MPTLTAQDLAALNPRCEYSPAGFDYTVAVSRAHALFDSVRQSFPEARLDDQVQDATYHAGITVGVGEVRLSNFGQLAVITSEERFAPEVVSRLVSLIEAAGYSHVPFEVFGAPFLARERFTGDLFTQLFDYV
jgi:hypothetical protein